MIKSKKEYKKAVDLLTRNLLEISLLESMPISSYSIENYVDVLEELYNSVLTNRKPVLFENINLSAQKNMLKLIKENQKLRSALNSKPTKKNAKLVENFLAITTKVLAETDEFTTSDSDESAESKEVGSDNTVLGVASAFGGILTGLKAKIEMCNQDEDLLTVAGCQSLAFEDAIAQLKSLVSSCGDNEDCKSKIMKAVGRLEVLKSQAEDVANEEAVKVGLESVKDEDLSDFPTDFDLY